MREILFRGKRTDNDEWIYGSFCMDALEQKNGLCGVDGFIRLYDFDKGKMQSYEVDRDTVGQFTGQLDKNGEKIFEGDIIRYAELYEYNCYIESLDNSEAYDNVDFGDIWTVDEVVYGIKIGYPAFDLNRHDFEVNGLSELNESGGYFYEVIGNIYDNPELLEG